MAEHQLAQLIETLSAFRPKKRWWRSWVKRSAVAIIAREHEGQLEVLMIKRAEREGDPWSGHMAFPGGVMETDDAHGRMTAERETLEEIEVDLRLSAHFIGRLSDLVRSTHSGRRPMVITPYVFAAKVMPNPKPNHEVAEVVWVPLSFLADQTNRESLIWEKAGMKLEMPCYNYRQRQIWGISLSMLDELVGLLSFV